jgi:hypothetical protein
MFRLETTVGLDFIKSTYFSVTRRAFIEAKYVQKAFLRPLPSANQIRSSTRTIKRWTVMKSAISTDRDDETSKTPNRPLLSKYGFNFLRYFFTFII